MILTIIILGSVINASIITVDQKTVCQCNQILTDENCQQMRFSCTWLNNQCTDISCSSLQLIGCQQNPYCYYNNEQCLEFTGCQQLSGNSITSCQTQNISCCWVSGTNCISHNDVSCDQILDETYCTYAGNGLCYWNLNLNICSQLEECAQLTGQMTCSKQQYQEYACTWDYQTQACAATYCGAMQTNCNPILLSTQNLKQYQVCVWSDDNCSNGSSNQLSQEYCLGSTLYTSSWNTHFNKCVACNSINFNYLLPYTMVILILQIII